MPGASCSVNLDCNPKCFELGGYSEDLSARSGKSWDGFLGLNGDLPNPLAEMKTNYQILGISQKATPEHIKQTLPHARKELPSGPVC